jgi:hypothetical protein
LYIKPKAGPIAVFYDVAYNEWQDAQFIVKIWLPRSSYPSTGISKS